MKFKELKGMNKTELEKQLSELQVGLMKENAHIATGTTPKSPGQLKATKKTIARIKSILGGQIRHE